MSSLDTTRSRAGHEGAVDVHVRPLASPLPVGLFSFGVGMLLLFGQSLHWVPVAESSTLGLVLAAFVFPLEGAAMILAFLSRDVVAATIFGLFATSWLAFGLSLATSDPGSVSHTIGLFSIALAVFLLPLSVVAASGKPLIAGMVALSAVRALLYGVYELTAVDLVLHVAGWVALAILAIAWYAGTAFLVEDLRQQPVLPTLRRGAAATALRDGLPEHRSRTDREAGVRQQL